MFEEQELPAGLYDAVLTSALEQRLGELVEQGLASTGAIKDSEAADRFALHLYTSVKRALAAHADQGRAAEGARVVRELLRLLDAEMRQYDALGDIPTTSPQVLHGITTLNPDGSPRVLRRPITPLQDTTILTNTKRDRNMWAHLTSEMGSASGVDAIVAFITRSGIRPMMQEITRLTDEGHRVRILTTTFTGVTEVAALKLLRDAGVEVRVSYDTTATRLHAKAWLFHRPGGSSTAFVGSSNLTSHGLGSGQEWNVRLSSRRNPDAVEKLRNAFEAYWDSGDFVAFEPDEFRERSSIARAVDPETIAPLWDLQPHPFQDRLLEQIAVSRERGHHRNLLVAATGTGKTVMAAFDFARLQRDLSRARLLFVAHREEILNQSLQTFRAVLKDPSFGETWVGGRRPQEFRHVFASIQSLAASGVQALDPEHFDVVIVDEFHHAAARSYATLLNHVQPVELLGLTATPERADGQSILHYFDDRIAAEMRLWDAIAEGRLTPFQYFGINDGTDLREVRWLRGRGYDISALEIIYTADDAWANVVVRKLIEQVGSDLDIRAMGFCVSVAHAEFMARKFQERGIAAVAVHGGTPEDERRAALRRLRDGEIKVLFSVDLFNEGVDIPTIDTLLLLRPTESATLFLQQLGRGLRKHQGKDVCTVLDFIGQHRKEYRFDLKLRAMIGGGSRKVIESNVREGFPSLPPGVSVSLDRVAQQIILESIKRSLPSTSRARAAELRAMVDGGVELTLANYLRETGLDLDEVYSSSGSWSDLLEGAKLDTLPAGPHESILRRAIGRLLHIDDSERLEFYLRMMGEADPASALDTLSERERRLWKMLLVQVLDQAVKRKGTSLEAATSVLAEHPQVRSELREVFGILRERIDHLHLDLAARPEAPLKIHARYTRLEILAALGIGDGLNTPEWREGVKWLPEQGLDVFAVTIDKADGGFSPTTAYNDYAINRNLFHWESQSTTSADSATGQRYQEHAQRGTGVLLFARVKQSSRDFVLLGPATYVSHTGSRPMAIVWRLAEPIPGDLLPDLMTVGVA